MVLNTQIPARDHEGFYTHPTKDLKVPSVTTIISVLNKPALPPSAAKLTATFAYDTAGAWLELERQAAIDHLKAQYRREWSFKAWRGSAVHRAVELYLLGEPIPDEIEISERRQVVATFGRDVLDPYLAQFRDFLDVYRPTFDAVEVEVWSERQAHAGKLDAACRLCGGRFLMDVKSGDSGVWPESALQLAAYGHSETVVDRRTLTESPLGPVDGAFVLHLQPTYFNVVRVDISDETYRTFLYAREVWWWQRERARGCLGLPMPQPEPATAGISELEGRP